MNVAFYLWSTNFTSATSEPGPTSISCIQGPTSVLLLEQAPRLPLRALITPRAPLAALSPISIAG